jgi:phenolic acid decarboxylase
MDDVRGTNRVIGKTLRFTWTDGPTKGETHEHRFHPDGTVEYARLEGGKAKGDYTKEKKYAAVRITDDVYLVSYLAASGFTLTVALNFADGNLAGFASNDKQWFACNGRFEKVA